MAEDHPGMISAERAASNDCFGNDRGDRGGPALVGAEHTPTPIPVTYVGPTDWLNAPPRRTDWPAGTPVWLLDVDGVLNAATTAPDHTIWPDYRSGFATALGRSWPITFSPAVTNTVAELSETRAAEVLWLTTWEDAANDDLAALLGLPHLPLAGRARDTDDENRHGWWKLQVARVVHQQGRDRPILWTDDELRHDLEAHEWIRRRGLGISPATHVGLEGEHLKMIRDFIHSRQPAGPPSARLRRRRSPSPSAAAPSRDAAGSAQPAWSR